MHAVSPWWYRQRSTPPWRKLCCGPGCSSLCGRAPGQGHILFLENESGQRDSKGQPTEARLNSYSKIGLAAEEVLDICYHRSLAGKNTGEHVATAALVCRKQGAILPCGPFQRGHHCIPCFLPALNRSLPANCSYVQEANLASGKQAAQRDTWTMPGLWAVLLFPSYAVRQALSSPAACPLPPAAALSLALQAPLLPRPCLTPSPGAETHRS